MSDEHARTREQILEVARDAELEGRLEEAAGLRGLVGVPQDPIEELLGKTMVSVTRDTQNGEDTVTFEAVTGERWVMDYAQDCCATCNIDDVVGDLQDLVGAPIAMAEESTNSDGPPLNEYDGSFTWTFYKFATVKGYVTIRWYGSSNGYYSETAQFRRVS